jgi:hypothetical protein
MSINSLHLQMNNRTRIDGVHGAAGVADGEESSRQELALDVAKEVWSSRVELGLIA